VDWKLAEWVAGVTASVIPEREREEIPVPADAEEKLIKFTKASERKIGRYTGLKALTPIPTATSLDRGEWITVNVNAMQEVLGRALDQIGKPKKDKTSKTSTSVDLSRPLRGVTETILAIEVGCVSGLLSQRVLGQYEFPLLDLKSEPRLFYVTPNLIRAANTFSADPDEIMKWVALHETTHALQFGAIPWLRPFITKSVEKLIKSINVDTQKLSKVPNSNDITSLIHAVRQGEVTAFVLGPERQALVEQLQTFMAVIEGYAEHVMDVVGAKEIPDLPRLRSALEQRRRERSGLLRLLERLLGFEVKLRQYEDGKRFCDAVVDSSGILTLNRVWESKKMLPTPAELTAPDLWLDRVSRTI
jgi:coenzyme F420 biosynthesis associated uncharacterized protein